VHRDAFVVARAVIDRGTGQDVEQRFIYDEDGNLTDQYIAGDTDCDGDVDFDDIIAFTVALSGRLAYEAAYPFCEWLSADIDGDGDVDFDDMNPFYSLLGNGGGTSWHYTWDAENRLIGVEPLLEPMEGFQKLSFGYDYRGRRVRKTVYTYNGTTETWVQTGDTKVVWAGWLLLLELDGTDSDAVLRKYTWGLDVAGQNGQFNSLESAGGIGGLLAVYDTNGTTTGQNPTEDDKTYVYLYDANGNVGQLVDWTDIPDWESKQLTSAQDWHADRLVARYEYDPYGNVVGPDTDSDGDWTDDAGPYATVNPFRFSTKQWDDETGLGYWGFRYYDPASGRWVSRDLIGERGGVNVYGYVFNIAPSRVDAFGFSDWVIPPPPDHRGPWHPHPRAPYGPQPEPTPTCPTPYLPPDRDVLRGTDCVGHACRDPHLRLGTGAIDELTRRGFAGPRDCDTPCEPCEVKCWVWEWDEYWYEEDGHTRLHDLSDDEPDLRQGHVTCGQVGPNGEEPKCYDKFGNWGEIPSEPRPCAENKPPAEEPFPYPSSGQGFWRVERRNMTERCFCGSAENMGPLGNATTQPGN